MRGKRRPDPAARRRVGIESAAVVFAVVMLVAGVTTVALAPRESRHRSEPGSTKWVLPPPTVPPLVSPGPGANLETVIREVPMRVATANIYSRMSWSGAAADLANLVDQNTDLVGLNEISPSRASAINAWVATKPGWHFYAPPSSPTPFRVSNSLLWNEARLDLIDSGSEFGSRSATRRYTVDSRWITWAKFRVRKTGTTVYFLVTHMDPDVERAGVPRRNATVGANQIYMGKLKSFAQQLVNPRTKGDQPSNVIIVGDWNVNALADRKVAAAEMPFAFLEGRGAGPIISSYTALGFNFPPTSPRSRRWIDYVALWAKMPLGGPELSFTKQYSPSPVNSDHNPVIVDLVLRHSGVKVVGEGSKQVRSNSPPPGPTPVAAG